jgi:hypothetical protein
LCSRTCAGFQEKAGLSSELDCKAPSYATVIRLYWCFHYGNEKRGLRRRGIDREPYADTCELMRKVIAGEALEF